VKRILHFHLLVLGVGATAILCIELWKFIEYILKN
jgi:hypothetical protein